MTRLYAAIGKLRAKTRSLIRPVNKYSCIEKYRPKSLLVVGCGNGELDSIRQNFDGIIHGIDIASSNKMQECQELITTPENFHLAIKRVNRKYDMILSAHNLEHCNHPVRTLIAICSLLEDGGILYLSTPSEKSLQFPSRPGTLNFHDDDTHKALLQTSLIKRILLRSGIRPIEFHERYRPVLGCIIGLVLEPISVLRQRTFSFTWDFYGFERILIARRLP